MAKSDDMGLRRAASVMCWHIQRGGTESHAVARASEREPDLTERDLQYALHWARDSLAFCDALNMACEISENGCTLDMELPQPGECSRHAEMDICELAARFNLPR